jgi:DNA-binding NarL/FixJ family response regulator
MSIRIVLADDHMIFLDGLRVLLEKQPDLEVIALVNDGLETLRIARESCPTSSSWTCRCLV